MTEENKPIKASGIGDKTPLTDRLNNPENWKGTDDDHFWMRWRIKIKSWFAFSSRSPNGIAFSFVFFPGMWIFPFTVWFTGTSWWYLLPIGIIPVLRKWRAVPTMIFGVKGKGPWRIEDNRTQAPLEYKNTNWVFMPRIETSAASVMTTFYFSRIQKWTRWHFAIHWPLLITFHWYIKAEEVLTPEVNKDVDGKVIATYRGWHYDADGVFWGDGAALGNFK